MNFEIKTIESFDRQIKRLAKKYPSVKLDEGELDALLLEIID